MPLPWSAGSLHALKGVIARHWGYHEFRPLQEAAMAAVLTGRDSLVVLPTGGGKSLCYQAPAVLKGDTTVVVSPLIALMKDQVDGLRACGIPAVQIDSSQSPAERAIAEQDIRNRSVRLVFVAPERLVLTDFCRLLRDLEVRTFAIDEAHCISHWGHDFRPEYRQLSRLREWFPEASLHAYTATATERVRQDIAGQLDLRQPEILVGNFDRPNLIYRVIPRRDTIQQVLEVLHRHPREAGIIYCMTRREVDDLSAILKQRGLDALAYHAGLTTEQRREAQEAFITERCDLIVATVAFGMGIDRSNIRFVLHTSMPKSVEHYQQEAGRAGRDGLEAECVLHYSGESFLRWKSIIEKSAAETGADPTYVTSALRHLGDMDRYCRGAVCRHRSLVEYFGQSYGPASCSACDLCLNETEEVPDATVVAQKILSCVARVKESFGIHHIVGVLRGQDIEAIRKHHHDQLSTYGLLRGHSQPEVRDWIYQLLGQGVLVQEEIALRSGARIPILRLNPASWEVLRGQRQVRLVQINRREKAAKEKKEASSWEGVDRGLFEVLRALRRQLADERHVPPYVIFNDATLRELARARPSTAERMHLVYGVGDAKLRDFGNRFLQAIAEHCRSNDLSMDQADMPRLPPREEGTKGSRPQPQRQQAWELFRQGASIEDVVGQTGRARSTVVEYLADFIRQERPPSIAPWVADEVYSRVQAAVRQVGTDRLKPIYLALDETVAYDAIRLVLAYLSTCT